MTKRPDLALSGVILTDPAVWNKLSSSSIQNIKQSKAKAKVKDSVALLDGYN